LARKQENIPLVVRGFFMAKKYTFTSESVCSGHPDKICDQVSDRIVDAAFAVDPHARVAVETLVTEDHIVLAGEVTSSELIHYESLAREEIARLGYANPVLHFTDQSPIDIHIHSQSREIAVGVDAEGAGDQGMMFGYACRDNSAFMPMPIYLSHRLAEKIDDLRESKQLSYLRPDGKTQVTVQYENDTPVAVTDVIVAVPHDEDVAIEQVQDDIYNHAVIPVLEKEGFSLAKKHMVLNGTGVWHLSGPAADTGVTGRKIVVDTYGGFARVGGGAFSGKDPSKVDRSGAYACRYLAKNIVAAGLADRAEVYLAYFIGAKKPLMQEVETFGTEKVSHKAIKDFMNNLLDTSVAGIIETLELRRPIYHKTASYGHFGRDIFPWEKIASV
jgi:S-adenosylmethionine synthetase